MRLVKVRCWENVVKSKAGIFNVDISYPEENSGYDLIICKNCGKVYAVSIADEVYVGPLRSEILRNLNCSVCGVKMNEYWGSYPDVCMNSEGQLETYKRDPLIPLEIYSTIKEFHCIN